MKMSASVEVLEPRETRGLSLVKPLDETEGQTSATKGQAQDRRNNATFLKGVNCLAIAALLVAAGFWSHLGRFDLAVRFIVAAGAALAMFHAFHIRQFVLAGLFAALVVLYNPVATVLSFSGAWQRAVVIASVLPFLASFWPARFEDGIR
jgi:lysylphosphatidylglycerol synthetase-like protein (DUF2156 family)